MTSSNAIGSNTKSAAHLLKIFAWVILFIIGTIVASVLAVNFLGKETEQSTPVFWASIGAVFFVCFMLITTANGLTKHRQWARYVGVVLAALSLVVFPVGTVLGLFILSYLHKGWDER